MIGWHIEVIRSVYDLASRGATKCLNTRTKHSEWRTHRAMPSMERHGEPRGGCKVMTFLGRSATIALGAIVLMIPGLGSARTLDEILSSKKLVVGVNPTLPPLGLFNDKNEIDGFDVEISRKLAEMLGVQLEVVKVGSPDRVPFVASGKIDYVMGALTRTPERAKVIDF